jgi:hypothetical protein
VGASFLRLSERLQQEHRAGVVVTLAEEPSSTSDAGTASSTSDAETASSTSGAETASSTSDAETASSTSDDGDQANVTNVTNGTNETQDRVLPLSEAEAEQATPLREEQCNMNLIQRLEADWVSACYHWDNMDPNLAQMLSKWVNFGESSLTDKGYAEVCVQGEPCIAAVHAYYQAFVEEGCAERLQQESTYKLAVSLERAADACLVVGEAAKLDHKKASVVHDDEALGQSIEGCYHEFPACAPNCLLLPFTPGVPGGQRLEEIYSVAGTCYKAKTRCQGCLFKPNDNPNDLEPYVCPAVKCMTINRYAAQDSPILSADECKPVCKGSPPCGSDHCGGSCGTCDETEECVMQSCIYRTFDQRFEPKDTREMPEWYKDYEQERSMEQYEGHREEGLVARLFPDFQPKALGKKLGISPNE